MTEPPDWGWGEPKEPEPEEPGKDYAPPVSAFPYTPDGMAPPAGEPVEPPPTGAPVIPAGADAPAPSAFPPPFGAAPVAPPAAPSPFAHAAPPPVAPGVDPAEIPLAMPPMGALPLNPDAAAAPYVAPIAARPPVAPPAPLYDTGWGNTDELAKPPEEDFAPEVPVVTPFGSVFGAPAVAPSIEPVAPVPAPLPVVPQPALAAPPPPVPAAPPAPVYNTGWGNTDELAKPPEEDYAPEVPTVTPFGSVFDAAALTEAVTPPPAPPAPSPLAQFAATAAAPPPVAAAPVPPTAAPTGAATQPPLAPIAPPVAAAPPTFAPPAGPSFAPPVGQPVRAAGPSFAPPAGPPVVPATPPAQQPMYDLTGQLISQPDVPVEAPPLPTQWTIATPAPAQYFSPPVTEVFGAPPTALPTTSHWDAYDTTTPPPSIHNFTPYVSPPRPPKSHTSAIVLGVIAVLVLGVVGVLAYHFWPTSTPAAAAKPSGSPAPGASAPVGTTVTKHGVTVTLGPAWTVVPTEKAAADRFFAQFKVTHPNYAPGVKTPDLAQLTTFAVEPQGLGVRGVTFTGPTDGNDPPSTIIKDAPAVVKGLKGTGLSTKTTTFNGYPTVLLTFHVPKSTRDKSNSYWEMAIVHGPKKSAIITVISSNQSAAAAQINQIASTIELRPGV